MVNNFPPTVTILGANVELGSSVLLSEIFTVEDVDPDSEVLAFRFSDRDISAQSGQFSVNGNFVNQGQVIELPIDQLDTVRYHAGSVIGSELVSVEVFDGIFWSEPGVGALFSVTPNDDAPIGMGTNFDVVALERVDIAPFVSSFDPDGFPIIEYLFVDRDEDIFGSSFFLDGVEQEAGVFFSVTPEELPLLQYRGAQYGKSEEISFFVRDEGSFSELVSFTATTLPNANDPTVQAVPTVLSLGTSVPASQLFTFNDADGNTLKEIGFRDLGANPESGFFTVNGVQQAAGEFFFVDAADLGQVQYVSGSNFSLEQFQVQASDGQRLSTIGFADVSTVALPTISSEQSIIVLDTLEQVVLSSLIEVQSDLAPTFYEVIDLNTAADSARLVVNGNSLEAGIVHRISAADFTTTFIQGGFDDFGRSFDDFQIRFDNGNEFSPWTGLSFSTDPVAEAALLDIGRWDQDPGETLELTFSFPQIVPAYYCELGFPECTDFEPLLDVGIRTAIRDITSNLSDFFNINFTEVPAFVPSDITFATTNTLSGAAFAFAFAPGTPEIPGEPNFGGDIFGTIDELPTLTNSAPGEFGRVVFIHEIGHALGLAHPIALERRLPVGTENHQFTVMSINTAFFDPITGAGVFPETPQLYDFLALAELYGVNPNFQTGNNQLRFDNVRTNPQLVYDAGGIDTFNLNNHTQSAVIDLREGQFSSVTDIANNVAIAYGTTIEHARGGQGNDTIIGNSGNNSLIGSLGDDLLRGGRGVDFLHGNEGRDIYDYFIGDGNDVIDERFGAGGDAIQVHLFDEFVFDSNGTDLLGGTTLEENFEFLRDGNDLEIRLTLDGLADNGSIRITDMGFGRQRVETLRLFDFDGDQVGPDINLRSIFEFAPSNPTAFAITDNTSRFGNLATPV